MKWQIWQWQGPRSVPDRVWRAMSAQFRLDVSQVTKMQYVQKRGLYAGRRVTYLRVFDPTAIPNVAEVIRRYDDLAGYSEAILCEGKIERDGYVHLVDKRKTKGHGGVKSPQASPVRASNS